MKKILSLTLAFAMCLTLLAGCGTKLELEQNELKFTAAGETAQLEVKTNAKELVYSSNDESVATVDDNGLVTAVAPGAAVISIYADDEERVLCSVKCDWQVQVDLAAFYNETYDVLFPLDADGNPTGPFTEDFAAATEMLDAFYPGLSAIETKQCMVLMPAMTGVPYEVVLVEVANSADVEAVKTILQTRIDTETANQFNYPSVIENWELNSRIVSNGNYVMMAVCAVCDSFVDAFNALF